MSLPDKAFPVSWDQFHRDARALAWRVAGMQREWRAMVAITRGGLVPGSHHLPRAWHPHDRDGMHCLLP